MEQNNVDPSIAELRLYDAALKHLEKWVLFLDLPQAQLPTIKVRICSEAALPTRHGKPVVSESAIISTHDLSEFIICILNTCDEAKLEKVILHELLVVVMECLKGDGREFIVSIATMTLMKFDHLVTAVSDLTEKVEAQLGLK